MTSLAAFGDISAASQRASSRVATSRSRDVNRSAARAIRAAMSTRAISCATYSFVSTRLPTIVPTRAAISSQLAGISAVCGIGRPSGRRKIAVTANQSASPPTIPASAIASIHPPHHVARSGKKATASAAAASSTPSASRRWRRGARSVTLAHGRACPGRPAADHRRRRDGRRTRLRLTSQTPRGERRTAGRKSAARKNSE